MFSCMEGDAKSKPKKYFPYLQVEFGGKIMYIHKTTAIWLFREDERASSDCLFRVWCKQPYSSSTPLAKCSAVSKDIDMQPISSTVQIELYVFKKDNGWSIGRMLQFAELQEKRISGQQFKGFKTDVSKSDLGVLCSWYTPMSGSSNFQLKESCTTSIITHCYHPLKSYVFTHQQLFNIC